MRVLAVIAAVVLPGCLLPTNQISGRWNVGGEGGCAAGDVINVSVPEDYDDLGDGFSQHRCVDRTFTIDVAEDLYEFQVEFEVWPLVNRGPDLGATVQLTRVIGDFNLGIVQFVEAAP